MCTCACSDTDVHIFSNSESLSQSYVIDYDFTFQHKFQSSQIKFFQTAICDDGCGEDMECTEPNICSCIDGWSGSNCSIGMIIYNLHCKLSLLLCSSHL